ncbi:MAG: hypothetical protein KF712_15760 [Akkermansiaceae bacterium]|nr:hypothetical protein [Akkermansiaceae bacterium]
MSYFRTGDSWTLEKVTFCPRDGDPAIESIRADRYGRAGRPFAWTKAMRALCLLLLRYKVDPRNSDCMDGNKNSPVQTLYHLLDHPERSAAAIPFTTAEGVCHLKAILSCLNAGIGPDGLPHKRIAIEKDRLPVENLVILANSQPAGDDLIRHLIADLSKAWPSFAASATPVAPQVELGRFPNSKDALVGRTAELAELDSRTRSHRLIVLEAPGGSGKTSLVVTWLNRLLESETHPFPRIFGWSFSEQSRAADHTMAADECFGELIRFLGDPSPPGQSAYQRGRTAAKALIGKSALVILDGVETLQITTGPSTGHPHDPALKGFLHEMATAGAGCCILCTRLTLPVLGPDTHLPLGPLAHAARIGLLKNHGITGSQADLRRLGDLSQGHPLTLSLIGIYLSKAHGGSARCLAEDPIVLHEDGGPGSHARLLMAEHTERLKGTAHETLIHLLSLFDRKVTLDELSDLIFHTPGLSFGTAVIASLPQLRAIAADLASSGLLTAGTASLECHPLVARYFRDRFKATQPANYRSAHSRLYEKIISDPSIHHHPENAAQYEALLRSFFHGREAGRMAECWREIAWKRIMRSGREYHLTAHLGEFHLCLRAWASFWETPFEKLHPDLPPEAHPIVQASAGFSLFMVERMEESERVIRRALKRSLLSTRPHHALQASVVLGYIRIRQRRYADARKALAPAAGLARLVGDRDAPDHVLLAPICHLALVHTLEGRLHRARNLFQYALKRYRSGQHPELPPQLLSTYWEFLIRTNDLVTLGKSLAGNAEQLRSIPLLEQIGIVPLYRAKSAIAQYHSRADPSLLTSIDLHTHEACEQSSLNGWKVFHTDNLLTRARALELLGKCDAALSTRREARDLARSLGFSDSESTARDLLH